jgi:hypothetical protein
MCGYNFVEMVARENPSVSWQKAVGYEK